MTIGVRRSMRFRPAAGWGGALAVVAGVLGGCAGPQLPHGDGEHLVIGYEGGSARTLMLQPVAAGRLSSQFGWRQDPFTGNRRAHRGIDYQAPTGAPVAAAGGGTVVAVGWRGGYGNYVRIRHDRRYETAYAHLSDYAADLVPGRRVRQGEVIGFVGSTGRSTGAHLHYEVLAGGVQFDPLGAATAVAADAPVNGGLAVGGND